MGRPKGSKNFTPGDNEGDVQTIDVPESPEVSKVVDDDEYTLEVIKDEYGAVDPFYLSNKDPEFAYRFLRDNDQNLSLKTGNLLFQKGGWQLCTRAHLLKLGIEERYIGPDGLYHVGDQILARMPKKLFEEKEAYKQKQANEPMSAVNRLLKEGDPSTGGKEMHESMRGIQTRKQLKMD